MARRIGKHLSRRAREEMLPHAVELAGSSISCSPADPRASTLDGGRAYTLASFAGNRAALLATGSLRAGLSALVKLTGVNVDAAVLAPVILQVEEARELLHFAISEAHFEARHRAGADRR
jgi:hypothetical protein